jgi:hypothetical protein
MHELKSDIGNHYGWLAVTSEADDPATQLRFKHVSRKPQEARIRKGLRNSSLYPLSEAILNELIEKGSVITGNLATYTSQFPPQRIKVAENAGLFYLSIVSEKNMDSYFLRTPEWEHVRSAMFDITQNTFVLPTPAILTAYNPFCVYAPFDTPSWDHFENANNELIATFEEEVKKIDASESAGFMRGKVLAEYYEVIARLERVQSIMDALHTPSDDGFEIDK